MRYPHPYHNKTPEGILKRLAEDEGYDDPWAYLETVAYDSVQPGVCYKCESVNFSLEPDQRGGWCEECETPTCQSVSVLAGVI